MASCELGFASHCTIWSTTKLQRCESDILCRLDKCSCVVAIPYGALASVVNGTSGTVVVAKLNDDVVSSFAEVGDFDKTFTNWKVAIPAGKVVQISIADSKDDEAWSGNVRAVV